MLCSKIEQHASNHLVIYFVFTTRKAMERSERKKVVMELGMRPSQEQMKMNANKSLYISNLVL